MHIRSVNPLQTACSMSKGTCDFIEAPEKISLSVLSLSVTAIQKCTSGRPLQGQFQQQQKLHALTFQYIEQISASHCHIQIPHTVRFNPPRS